MDIIGAFLGVILAPLPSIGKKIIIAWGVR
jgi:hypothetical protein